MGSKMLVEIHGQDQDQVHEKLHVRARYCITNAATLQAKLF